MTDLIQDSEPVPVAEPAPAVEVSILGSLRQQRSKIGEGADPLYLSVPGYDDKLVLRFKWVPFKTLTRTAQQLSKMTEPSEQAVAAAADTIVAACEEVCVRVADSDKPAAAGYPKGVYPLSTNSVPVDFSDGDRLSYALGFQKPKDARTCAVLTFKNEYALIDVATDVTEWLRDTTRKVDEEFVGE